MTVPTLRVHTDSVIAKLESVGLSVGDGESPAPPSCAVYTIPGGRSYGSLQEPNEDADFVYQVTCVGITREQAEWVADKAIAALLGGVTVADRHIARVMVDAFPGVFRDDDATPPVFVSTPRFRLITTPD